MNLPKKCPNCEGKKFKSMDHPYVLTSASKNKHNEKYTIHQKNGIFVRAWVCEKCSNVVLFKEQYDVDLR